MKESEENINKKGWMRERSHAKKEMNMLLGWLVFLIFDVVGGRNQPRRGRLEGGIKKSQKWKIGDKWFLIIQNLLPV